MKSSFLPMVLVAAVLSGCGKKQPAVELLNSKASPAPGTAFNPIEGQVVTSYIDPKAGTTSTLFGNATAAESLGKGYREGAVIRLVTWKQQADPNWFGARIPGALQSVETVTFAAGDQPRYERREGEKLTVHDGASEEESKARIAWITGLRPAVMP